MKLLITILFLITATSLDAKKIIVGERAQFRSLKSAIAAAENSDTIVVQKGVFKEGNIILTKSLVILGEGDPILDGEGKYEILTISGSDIVVSGITFRNSGNSSMNDDAAINIIDATRIRIENNTILNCYFAVHIANATYCVIQKNKIIGTPKSEQTSGNGIHLWKCENMLVFANDITGHRDGIYFEFVTHSIIQQNISHKNIRYGLHFMFSNNDCYIKNTFSDNGAGVAVMYSHHVLMHSNRFENNWGPNAYGLLLKEINDSHILGNVFDENTAGIYLEGTNRVEVLKNRFHRNGWALRIQASCMDNTVRFNSFTGNSFDVSTNGSLSLNKFLHNYWDKYEGYDLNKDGWGDVPYHPVSLYSMVIEQNPGSVILLRSFMVTLLDKAEKAIPSLTPEQMVDEAPSMKQFKL